MRAYRSLRSFNTRSCEGKSWAIEITLFNRVKVEEMDWREEIVVTGPAMETWTSAILCCGNLDVHHTVAMKEDRKAC